MPSRRCSAPPGAGKTTGPAADARTRTRPWCHVLPWPSAAPPLPSGPRGRRPPRRCARPSRTNHPGPAPDALRRRRRPRRPRRRDSSTSSGLRGLRRRAPRRPLARHGPPTRPRRRTVGRPAHPPPRRARRRALAPREHLAVRAAAWPRRPRRHCPVHHHRPQGGRPDRRPCRHHRRGSSRRGPERTRLRPDQAAPSRGGQDATRRTPRRRCSAARHGRRRSVEVVAEDGSSTRRLRQQLRRRSAKPPSGTASWSTSSPTRSVTPAPSPSPCPPPASCPPPPRSPARPVRTTVHDRGPLAPPVSSRPVSSPLRPVRYELRRMLGVRTTPLIVAAVLIASVVLAVPLARTGRTPLPGSLAAWPALLPLPPAALGAGLLGALAFGDEFRYPALAAARGTVPRRLGLLAAKLTVTAGAALSLAAPRGRRGHRCAASGLRGRRRSRTGQLACPDAGWAGLAVGCAWAGLLAAGVFRITVAGLAAVARRTDPGRTPSTEGACRSVGTFGRRTPGQAARAGVAANGRIRPIIG